MKATQFVSLVLVLALFALPSWGQNIAGVDFIDGPGGAITVTVSSENPPTSDSIQSVNGNNMDADYLIAMTQGNGRGQWHSLDGSVPAWIQWDFDQAYKLKDMWLWNANQPGQASRSVQKADVFVNDGGGYELLTEYRFDQGPAHSDGTAGGDPEAPYAHDHYGPGSNEVDLGGRTLTGVRLEMNKPLAPALPGGEVFLGKGKGFQSCCTGDDLEFWATIEDEIGAGSAVTENIDVFGDFSNYGGGGCCFVIEEVRFNIIPEPATFGLVLAGIPLLMRRRRA